MEILILEDDKDLRTLYSKALTFKSHQVTATSSALEAIETLKSMASPPDLAILDMSMEGLSGDAVVEFIRLHSQMPQLPIIVVTCDESYRQKLGDLNVFFLAKPISLPDLYMAIGRVLPAQVG